MCVGVGTVMPSPVDMVKLNQSDGVCFIRMFAMPHNSN